MAKYNPDELLQVVWRDTGDTVKIPRHLLSGGTKQAQQRYLVASKQLLDPSAPVLEPSEEPAVVQQVIQDNAAVTALQGRVTALEQLDRPQLPSEESLAAWARAAERVGLSHAELAATQEATVKVVEQVGADAETRLDQLDAQQQALIEQVTGNLAANKDELNASILASQAQLAEFETEAEARAVANAETKAMSAAREEARRLMPNYAGISSITCTEDPIDVDDSWNDRWLGRKPKVGDTAWVVSKSGITFRRYINGGWSADAPELEPRVEVASQPLAILDQSTHTQVAQTIVRAGGGGGGGSGEALLVNRVNLGGSTFIGDTSNHGADDIRSGQFEFELRALDGSLIGRTLSVIAAFNFEPSAGPVFTEFAIEGALKTVFEANLAMQLAPARIPPGVVASLPAGAQALLTSLAVQLKPGGGDGGVTRFALRGSVEYNQLGQGRAYGPTDKMPQLLWHWG